MNETLQTALLAVNTAGLFLVLLELAGKTKKNKSGVILDSCALIDGRVEEVIKIGFLDGDIIVPSFVLRELQMLADGSDTHKRARARHGLEIAEQLKKNYADRFKINESIKSTEKTDEQLIILAKKLGSKLCTTDYNLNKVAGVEGVVVLNVNELAQVLRPTFLPGDEQEVKILQKGEGRGQGVGYLEDGTMVVVDNAFKLIGSKQVVIIERSLQTVAGKMSFAHLKQSSNQKR
ncbi:MAG: TRAM domain-containing protein [bacterium]